MIVRSSPMLEKYSQAHLRISCFRPRRNFFPKPSQIHQKTSPEYAQASPNMSQTSRKSDPDKTKKWSERPDMCCLESPDICCLERPDMCCLERPDMCCLERPDMCCLGRPHMCCLERPHMCCVESWETRHVVGCKSCRRMQVLSQDASLVVGCIVQYRLWE